MTVHDNATFVRQKIHETGAERGSKAAGLLLILLARPRRASLRRPPGPPAAQTEPTPAPAPNAAPQKRAGKRSVEQPRGHERSDTARSAEAAVMIDQLAHGRRAAAIADMALST